MSTHRLRTIVGKVGFALLIVVIFVYLMFPFYWATISALKTDAELVATPGSLWPREVSLHNFRAVLTNERILVGLRNSVIVAGGATLLSLVIAVFAAYAIARLRFRGRVAMLYLVLSMTMFPGIAILSGLYEIQRVVALPTLLKLILTYQVFGLPFNLWVLTTFFRAVPDELTQAARIDGASHVQALWHVMLPVSGPALVTTGLLSFIGGWNEYLFALTYTAIEPDAQTVSVAVANLSGIVRMQIPAGLMMAAAIVISVPLVLLVLVFQDRIVDGLTAGAVKG